MEYYSAIKNTFESILVRCINPEPIMQSEVSQNEKDKYHILTHIYGIKKDGILMILLEGQQRRQRHKEQMSGYNAGRRGWDDLRK